MPRAYDRSPMLPRVVHPGGGRTRARSRDRDQVTDALSHAFADDQLSEDEHEARVADALAATRLDELRSLVADLQLPEGHPAALVRRDEPERRRGDRRRLWSWGLAAAGLVGVVAVIGAVSDGEGERDVRPLTESGYRLFVEEYADRFDSTEAYRAELSDDFVTVSVPADGGEGRFLTYYWDDDGFTYSENGGTAPAGAATVDLAAVDAERLAANLRTALDSLGVEDPVADRVIVDDDLQPSLYRAVNGLGLRAPVPPHVQIFVSNEFQEQGSLTTDLAGGEVLAEVPFEG